MTQHWKGAGWWKGSTSKTSFWIRDFQRPLSITNWFQNARCYLERLLQFSVFIKTLLYPVADLKLEVDGVPVSVKAAVSQTLPVSVLLGTDVPELGRLLGVKSSMFGENGRQGVMMVVTRAGARKKEEEEELRRQKEVTSQVTTSPVQLSQEVAESEYSLPSVQSSLWEPPK